MFSKECPQIMKLVKFFVMYYLAFDICIHAIQQDLNLHLNDFSKIQNLKKIIYYFLNCIYTDWLGINKY